jgi:predicted peptidase
MKRTVVLLMLLAVSFVAEAQKIFDCSDKISGGYDFLLYLPESYEKTDEKLPVIFYLHGRSCTGTDINMVTKYGVITALRRGVDIDAIVIAPQVESVNRGWEPKKVIEVLEYVSEHYRVDENRVYAFGMSMGGNGVYKVLSAYPDKFAAGISMCGVCLVDEKPIANVPLWVIHGSEDEDINHSRSMDFVQKMIAGRMASRLHFTLLVGCNHSILARVFMLEEAYEWLFSHSLTDEGRPASKVFNLTADHLRNIHLHIKGKPRDIPIQKL